MNTIPIKSNAQLFLGAIVTGIAAAFLLSVLLAHTSHAEPVVGFKAGRIIEDSVFTNANSMSVTDIQNFLNSKVPNCDTNGTARASEYGRADLTHAQYAAMRGWSAPPYTCLRNYTENGLSSAQIIYNMAQQYQLNPQVFIVLLQKEQGLVTDTWPLASQYRAATGYGCPDTAPCDSQYYGLTNQLDWSGFMFRSILNNDPNWYTPYILGNNYIQWNPNKACGGSTVYIENRSTQALYNYTPYQPNQAALNAGYGGGDDCSAHGNRNFYLYFKDWFGYNAGPAAFTVPGSSVIYMPVNGYKLAVPYMAAMQDYGISAEAVQAVSQSYADSIPLPPAGISTSISHVIKSPYDTDEDGGSIYLVSRGKRYQFQSMQQFYDFGFKESDISYLPLSYVFSMRSNGMLPNFVTSPYGSVFKVDNGKKRAIFEYSTYISQNPSDTVAQLSYFLADKIPSGTPITDRPVMVQYPNSSAVTLYQNDTYYDIPDYNVFSCWNLNNPSFVPVYRIAQGDYIAPITSQSTLSCIVNDGNSTQAVSGNIRYSIPGSYGIPTPPPLSADLSALLHRIPLRSSDLKQYVKANDSAGIWYIYNGARRIIPSYTAFTLLGLNDSSIDTVSPSILNSLAPAGLKLADGLLVKTPDSAAVYVISQNQRIAYASSDLFSGYGNSWNAIETYPATALDQYYPYSSNNVASILVNKNTNQTYLINASTCYNLSTAVLTAMGKNAATLSASQPFEASIFKNFSAGSCKPGTLFLKDSNSSLVYWIDGSQKHPLYTYSAMLAKNNGQPPVVMNGDSLLLNSISTGQGYN